MRLLLGFPNHVSDLPLERRQTIIPGPETPNSYDSNWPESFLSLQGQLSMLPQQQGTTFLAGFSIRWVRSSRNSYVNCLSPEAKATAGQALFLSAQDAAKIKTFKWQKLDLGFFTGCQKFKGLISLCVENRDSHCKWSPLLRVCVYSCPCCE